MKISSKPCVSSTAPSPKYVLVLLCAVIFFGFTQLANAVSPTSYTTNFDSFSTGSINGQQGWSAANPNVDQSVTAVAAGDNVFRMSNAYGSGSFSDYPFGPAVQAAGEPASGASFNNFQMSLTFQSSTGAAQPGLFLGVGPSSSSNLAHRQGSFFIYDDSGAGLNVLWQDYVGGTFVNHLVATDLSYSGAHALSASLTFLAGPNNDLAQISVDGNPVGTYSDYEGLYGTPSSVNTVLFKTFSGYDASSLGGSDTSITGNGLNFDSLSYSVAAVPEASTWISGALSAFVLVLLGFRRRKAV